MVEFNGTLYSYVHNLQGDVVGIVDSAGSLVVEYKYDAWGKPTLVRTLTTAYEALAELNPFRYRGYVYDEETGLYYLRNRYYSVAINRFLNSDVFLVRTGLSERNVIAYCNNNPIACLDPEGTMLIAIFSNWFYESCLKAAENIIDSSGSPEENNLLAAMSDFYNATKEWLVLPTFNYHGNDPIDISVVSYTKTAHECGRAREILKKIIDFGIESLSTDEAANQINYLCAYYGVPQIGDWIKNGAEILSNTGILEGFLNEEPHIYYSHTILVKYTYENGYSIYGQYMYDSSDDNHACQHYNGIRGVVTCYNGFLPVGRIICDMVMLEI